MLAPIRLTNAAAQLVLRTQVRRIPTTHPHRSRPYAALLCNFDNGFTLIKAPCAISKNSGPVLEKPAGK